MKFKIFFAASLILAFTVSALAQTVKITPKKVVYARKFKVSLKEKRNFTVTYPVVTGAISQSARKNLEDTISYWRVFETSLKDSLNEYDWLSEAFYKVNYNENGILDISLTQEGAGAYPDSQTVNLVIDLKTGRQIKFQDVFKNDSREKFAAMIDRKLSVEEKEIVESVRADKDTFSNEEDRQSTIQMIEELKFTPESFDEFSVSDKGVTIFYDAGFPHVIQALEPNGRYFFTWTEVKSFIKPDGLLARFVR